VRKSRIEGHGLFAAAPISAGTVVERLGGRLVTDREVRLLIASASDYVDTVSIDEDVNLVLPAGSPVHFGNHSCDPTLWWVDPFTLVARVDIAEDVEITADYGTLTDDPDFVMDCDCRAASCRGRVTGSDWVRPELQRRYGDHWVPALRRRISSP
jgi:SET domain-containing protein